MLWRADDKKAVRFGDNYCNYSRLHMRSLNIIIIIIKYRWYMFIFEYRSITFGDQHNNSCKRVNNGSVFRRVLEIAGGI